MAAKSALNLCDCFFFLLVETLSEFDCDCFSLCFCRNVNTYIYIYKSCGYVNTYIHLVIFVSLGLRPQVALASRISPGSNKFKLHAKKTTKKHNEWHQNSPKREHTGAGTLPAPPLPRENDEKGHPKVEQTHIYIYIYKSCGYVNTYIYLVIFVSLGLRPQVLDIHVTTGGRPSAKPKNTKTTCLLRQN